MFKIILIGIVLLVAAILLYATTKPDNFSVKRTITIKASPDKVFALINDFNRWGAWSPWEKLDPEMKRTFSGTPSGPGSIYEWLGNSKVGQGRMEILQSTPAQIMIKLDFIKPFEGHNTAQFDLTSQDQSTVVTWTMFGPSTFMTKIMQVFTSMDSLIGKDFEAGLANMKAAAEAQ
jgi:uncharacterized protein YndB with AHSA1/START domain